METLVPITVSSSLHHLTGSYANCEVWVPHHPALLWSHQASGQVEEHHHLRAQDTGTHHEGIFPVPHEGEASPGVDLGVCIILLNEQPGAVVWGADPVGTTMGSLNNQPSQNSPTRPPEGPAVHWVLRPQALFE